MQNTQAQVNDRQQKWFNVNRSVSLGEIIVAATTIIATTVTAYFSIEKRVSMLERDQKYQIEVYNELKTDMRRANESLNEIKLMLKDKQDKAGVLKNSSF